ncbi:BamA/TamA family outer membrane protein [Acetobacter sp. AN02]|uniref:autotransporter assembly complex protein TamA n=1 Tax=Acetobacter sp. AN02 TaxID=2894186 RepID=UPI002434303D|nr:BamA/TamA family outer membrane protein [Acetobacter sp. AN02]MDG6095035.1 BamA/TamA family outer membrane protein [Acetobacter sp. AN02]
MKRHLIQAVLLSTLFAAAGHGFAADKKKKSAQDVYRASVVSSGNDDLDAALQASSEMISLQDTTETGPFALAGRVRSDYGRLKDALDSFGYYEGKVKISLKRPDGVSSPPALQIDGQAAELSSWLGALPKKETVAVRISAAPGPEYHIGTIEIADPEGHPMKLSSPEEKAFGLYSGDSANSANILKASGDLMQEYEDEGRPLAEVQTPVAWLRPETRTLDLHFVASPGPVARIGEITLEGLEKTNVQFIRHRLTIASGERYSPGRIEAARQDLAALGIFASVSIRKADKLAADGTIPLTITFREGKSRTVGAEAAYSTDLGGRLGANWTHNNIFGRAETLRLTALVTGVGGSAQQGLGYDIYADLMKPDFSGRRQTFSIRVEGLRQLFYSYHQTALLARAGITRIISRRWKVSYGGQWIQESVRQFGDTRSYTLLSAPLSANYDSTDLKSPLDAATHGARVSIGITPMESLGHSTAFFAIMQATASTYLDLSKIGLSRPGRSVIAVRGTVGTIQGASTYDIPPDQRLYAGGSATVRGFRYQGVGPQFGDTKYAIGGTALDAGTFEFRQRIGKSFGMTTFADAGQVGSDGMPFHGKLRVGAGGGVRYYTPIGPVRVDVAVPLNRQHRGDKWELYIGLGETF